MLLASGLVAGDGVLGAGFAACCAVGALAAALWASAARSAPDQGTR